jgi:hypothetical protein
MRKNSNYSQGTYRPTNGYKYIGTKHPRYLSSWELKFFRWCDNNPKIVKWGSESFAIPYRSPLDGRVHKYLVDNFIHIRDTNGCIKKYLIEIKPKKQTVPPKKHGNKKTSTMVYESQMYATNCAKWEAARKFCQKKNYKFIILTEDELFFRGKA